MSSPASPFSPPARMPAPPNRTGVATQRTAAAQRAGRRAGRRGHQQALLRQCLRGIPAGTGATGTQPGAAVVAVDEKGLLGDWKCRSTQADQYGIYRYPNFQCRIRRTDRGLFLEKTSGSQRVSGYLFREGTQRYVFLGGATVNDEPQVAFSGLAHGAPAESDVVALLRRTPVASSCCSRNGAAATRSSSSAAEAQALSSS
ncbi:DUF4893 domain-containing protein [Pseudomonas aeruginosa]|nr:DUF4893 domain-containing protein [Pseudomonas aeruginosa]